MSYTLPIMPFTIPDFTTLSKRFQKLVKLKKGLYFSGLESVTEESIFETVSKVTSRDYLFLKSMLIALKKHPNEFNYNI